MGYGAYPEMRDSGAEWIKEIPAHWQSKRLKFSVSLINEKVEAESSELSYMGLEHIESWSGKRIEDSTASSEGVATKFLPKDVLFGKLRPYLAKVHLASHEGLASTEALILRSQPEVSAAYLRYFLVSKDFINIVDSSTYGSKMPRASWDFIGNLPMLHPSLPEQQTIARFLDHKTTQIDVLIAKKEALLQKLAEKRTALISQAVTQGLDPTVPMQDSGVAWLGKIPAHWCMTRLKYATALIVDCPHDTPQYSPEGDFLVVRTADLSSGVMDLSSAYRVDENEYLKRIRRAEVKPGDILYGREGERWGFAAEVPEEPMVCLGQRMMQFRASAHFCPHYLMWHLNADCVYQQGVVDTYGSTAPHVNVETIKNYWLVEPPLAEQEAIAKHLDAVTTKFAKQVAAARSAISSLSEYRSALVTAAVTGKIDVRDVALPAEVSP